MRSVIWHHQTTIPEVVRNGDPDHNYNGCLNYSLAYMEVESMVLMALENIAVSSGSTCTSASLKPSSNVQERKLNFVRLWRFSNIGFIAGFWRRRNSKAHYIPLLFYINHEQQKQFFAGGME